MTEDLTAAEKREFDIKWRKAPHFGKGASAPALLPDESILLTSTDTNIYFGEEKLREGGVFHLTNLRMVFVRSQEKSARECPLWRVRSFSSKISGFLSVSYKLIFDLWDGKTGETNMWRVRLCDCESEEAFKIWTDARVRKVEPRRVLLSRQKSNVRLSSSAQRQGG